MAEFAGEMTLRSELPAVYELVQRTRVDSVQAEAWRLAAAGADEGTLLWAAEQTNGTRQDGRPWQSPAGGLYAALVLRPELPRERWPQLFGLAAVSLGAAVAELCQPLTPLAYAWPDRLRLGPDALASITLSADDEVAILAWAVNVAAVPEIAGRYACLELEGGAEATAGDVLSRTSRFFLDWINRWAEDGFDPARRAWLARGLLEASSEEGVVATGLTADGDLVTDSGVRRLADALTSDAAPGGPRPTS